MEGFRLDRKFQPRRDAVLIRPEDNERLSELCSHITAASSFDVQQLRMFVEVLGSVVNNFLDTSIGHNRVKDLAADPKTENLSHLIDHTKTYASLFCSQHALTNISLVDSEKAFLCSLGGCQDIENFKVLTNYILGLKQNCDAFLDGVDDVALYSYFVETFSLRSQEQLDEDLQALQDAVSEDIFDATSEAPTKETDGEKILEELRKMREGGGE